MSWIERISKKLKPKLDNLFRRKSSIPDNLWTNCAACSDIIYKEDIENNLNKPVILMGYYNTIFQLGEKIILKTLQAIRCGWINCGRLTVARK